MRATVRVPATVANLGPGFDILAVALQLQNEVRGESRDDAAIHVTVHPAVPELEDPERNLVVRAYGLACDRLGLQSADCGVDVHCVNAIPLSRGLGSSAAASLSGVLLAVALHRAPWDTSAILQLVAELEGHADNAAAALLGGLAICAPGAEPRSCDVPDELRAVLVLPEAGPSTLQARALVEKQFSREDAVFNASRCALLVRSLLLRDYAALREAMADRWHQSQRAAIFPAMQALIDTAYTAGADGACLAGAGPSVMALSAHGTVDIEHALRATALAHGVDAEILVLQPRNFGARVEVRP